jgi:hypothetical protein
MKQPLLEPPEEELAEVPPLLPVAQSGLQPAILDVEATASDAVAMCIMGRTWPGMRVAVGVGSRGLASLPQLVRGTLRALRAAGTDPFIVPAMGSHGGATADGQRAVLASLGITEATVGAQIEATMEAVPVGRVGDLDLYMDANAARADALFPVNRVKPHTSFDGPIQSGLAKMLVIGYGKQFGARAAHRLGGERLPDVIPPGARFICDSGRVLGGLASVENAAGQVALVQALSPEQIGREAEEQLLRRAEELMGRLPFDQVDVLIIDRFGKNVAGDGMDTKVTGRFGFFAMSDRPPSPKAIVLLQLTRESHGNAMGVGLADVITLEAYRSIDWTSTYMNVFTAGLAGFSRGKCPVVVRDADTAVRTALAMVGAFDPSRALVARISDTGHLRRMWLSRALLAKSRGVRSLPLDPTDPAGHRFLNEVGKSG